MKIALWSFVDSAVNPGLRRRFVRFWNFEMAIQYATNPYPTSKLTLPAFLSLRMSKPRMIAKCWCQGCLGGSVSQVVLAGATPLPDNACCHGVVTVVLVFILVVFLFCLCSLFFAALIVYVVLFFFCWMDNVVLSEYNISKGDVIGTGVIPLLY